MKNRKSQRGEVATVTILLAMWVSGVFVAGAVDEYKTTKSDKREAALVQLLEKSTSTVNVEVSR